MNTNNDKIIIDKKYGNFPYFVFYPELSPYTMVIGHIEDFNKYVDIIRERYVILNERYGICDKEMCENIFIDSAKNFVSLTHTLIPPIDTINSEKDLDEIIENFDSAILNSSIAESGDVLESTDSESKYMAVDIKSMQSILNNDPYLTSIGMYKNIANIDNKHDFKRIFADKMYVKFKDEDIGGHSKLLIQSKRKTEDIGVSRNVIDYMSRKSTKKLLDTFAIENNFTAIFVTLYYYSIDVWVNLLYCGGNKIAYNFLYAYKMLFEMAIDIKSIEMSIYPHIERNLAVYNVNNKNTLSHSNDIPMEPVAMAFAFGIKNEMEISPFQGGYTNALKKISKAKESSSFKSSS